jgi:phosphoribosylformimino-5-aminoimidazole carboxamide ribotide isomerase
MIPIIPVLDVMNGVVVRAIGGWRAEYQPIYSQLTPSTDPLDVLNALIDVTGSNSAYVADLDAITSGNGPSKAVLRLVENTEINLWIDFGIETIDDLFAIPDSVTPILGTETMSTFDVARAARERFHRVIGSIDCLRDQAIGKHQASSPEQLALQFLSCGIDELIVLDLAAVGREYTDNYQRVERLVTVTKICDAIVPQGRIFIAGGIRNREDLKWFDKPGISGVLVASALHDGTLA